MTTYGAQLIREARRRAGLTQTELANRAGTSQPAIARWESGRTAVSVDDAVRLVRLCGLDVEFQLVGRDISDIAQAERLAPLSAQQRLDRLGRVGSQLTALRAAGGAAAVSPRELDLRRLFAVLHRHHVSYVLIGGLAAVVHGSPFPTEDAVITPDDDRKNLDRLAAALRELDARIRTEGVPDGSPFACDAVPLASAQTWNLTTDAGDLDIAFRPSGTQGYDDLRRDAAWIDLYDVTVAVASLADVVRSKQAANRPKDQRVLPVLRELLTRRDFGG